MKQLFNQHDFLQLSSFLHYQLSGSHVNWRTVLNLLLGNRVDRLPEGPLLDTLIYLGQALGESKRRLGPLAILHPLRTAAIYLKADPNPKLLNILTALLHDKDEDISQDKVKGEWLFISHGYEQFLSRLSKDERRLLNERVSHLARKKGESYSVYLSRLLGQSQSTPELISIKLADRLDNTLDLRLDIDYSDEEVDCFQIIFGLLFIPNFQGVKTSYPHPVERKIDGANRLYQIYKSFELLNLLQEKKIQMDSVGQRLATCLAEAAIHEAKDILLHLFLYHITKTEQQREILLETISCGGNKESFSQSEDEDDCRIKLQNFTQEYFSYNDKQERDYLLAGLYQNKKSMAQLALLFISSFMSFSFR